MTAEKIRGSGDSKIKKLDNHFLRSSLTKKYSDCYPHIAYI